MPTPCDHLLDSFHSRAIRTGIGRALRIQFVPTEPPPKRLLELLHALDQAKETEETHGNKLKDRTRGQFADQKRDKRRAKVASSCDFKIERQGEDRPALEDFGVTKKRREYAKRLSHVSEKERIEKIPGGYVVRDANGQALVYVYRGAEALQANLLTADEALEIAIKIAKLRSLHDIERSARIRLRSVEPDEAIQRAVRMKLGEGLRCYYDIRPTLPERLYELVHQLEGKASEGVKSSD